MTRLGGGIADKSTAINRALTTKPAWMLQSLDALYR